MQVEEVIMLLRMFNEKKIISMGEEFLKKIPPNEVKNAIVNDIDLVKILFNHFHLSHPAVKRFAVPLLRNYWDQIEGFLKDINKIKSVLSLNEEVKKILWTPEGLKWLKKQQRKLYDALYFYTWYGKDPLGKNNPYIKKK